MYYNSVYMFCYDWWLCMVINIGVQYNGGFLPDIILLVINISVQYNGGFLPDIILLTQGYYHWGTWLNTM